MLSDQAITTAGDQVANMEMRGVIVNPLPGSILDSVVRACHVGGIDVWPNDRGEYDLHAYNISASANSTDTVTGNCEHTLTQAELATLVAPKVTGYLAFARTVVAPAVEDYVKNLDETVSIYRGQIAHDFEISTQALPSPLSDSGLVDSIKKGESVLPNEFALPYMRLPSAVGESLQALVRTGSPTLDSVINTWLEAKNPEWLQSVYDQLFGGSSNVREVNASAFFPDTQDGHDRLLAAFLFCRVLWDNPAEGVEMSLQPYNDKIAELRLQVASRLSQRMVSAERNEKAGNLLISSFGRKIVVNGPVYTKWLQAGGQNETLLGNALSSNPATTVEAIDARAEQAQADWKRHAAMNSVRFANAMFVRYKEAAEAEFMRLVAASSHDDMPLNEREDIVRRFKAALSMSRIEETKNLYCWALRLLGTSWFWKTDAYRILKTVCEVREGNPDLDAREAAAIAAIDYITYWVSTQMVLTRPANN